MKEQAELPTTGEKLLRALRFTRADRFLNSAMFGPALLLLLGFGSIKALYDLEILPRLVAISLFAVTCVIGCGLMARLIAQWWLKLDELERKVEGLAHVIWVASCLFLFVFAWVGAEIFSFSYPISSPWAIPGVCMFYVAVRVFVRWRVEG